LLTFNDILIFNLIYSLSLHSRWILLFKNSFIDVSFLNRMVFCSNSWGLGDLDIFWMTKDYGGLGAVPVYFWLPVHSLCTRYVEPDLRNLPKTKHFLITAAPQTASRKRTAQGQLFLPPLGCLSCQDFMNVTHFVRS